MLIISVSVIRSNNELIVNIDRFGVTPESRACLLRVLGYKLSKEIRLVESQGMIVGLFSETSRLLFLTFEEDISPRIKGSKFWINISKGTLD